MNVQVKHNGTNITGFVEEYTREHKVCTGIGSLSIKIARNIGRTFDPWDSIDIYENGSFKVRYYVSSVDDAIPSASITLDCQDVSKRLVDYFIPTSYTIDYPSYTRYWIEKFLTEAGVDSTFMTSSPGQLISNNTQLGLVSAYEQILTLLQMSGWYVYFNSSEHAVIGPLDADLAVSGRTISKSDILSISKISDDKMLRNRALVLGAFDPYTLSYAGADVTAHTRWNYDNRDVRAIVISNSNIPNASSAYGMANQIIKEFARITIEKHITVWGARNFNLGDSLRVTSTVWRGKGLITTFGTSMSKNGLVSNIILDERCPRLFGFFDFGDYVYVGTFGNGIWKKHIKFDPTWYDFSSGLTNLNITDLHINNGIFGSVATSGELYWTTEEGSWNNIHIESLQSSLDNTVASGAPTLATFSGIKARATIVDKISGTVKFGVDTSPRLNYGDYYIDMSGFVNSVTTPSGAMFSGGGRGWIVEFDVLNGDSSGISYPISYSGNFGMAVLDLENDGVNDYVSVWDSSGVPIPSEGINYSFGYHLTQPYASTKDSNEFAIAPHVVSYITDGQVSDHVTTGVFNPNSLVTIDNGINGQRNVMAFGKDSRARLTTFTKTFDEGQGKYVIDHVTITSSVTASITSPTYAVLGIYPDWYAQKFRIYFKQSVGGNETYRYQEWDAYHNTWGSVVNVATQNLEYPLFPNDSSANSSSSVVINNVIYDLKYYQQNSGTAGGFYTGPSYLFVYMEKLNMQTNSLEQKQLIRFLTEIGDSGKWEYFPGDPPSSAEGLGVFRRQLFRVFQNGFDGVKVLGWVETYDSEAPTHSREYAFYGDDSVVQSVKIYDGSTHRFPVTGSEITSSQLTLGKCVIGRAPSSSPDEGFAYNGDSFVTYVGYPPPYYLDKTRVFPMLNRGNLYIAVDTLGTFHLINATTLEEESPIVPPTNYTLYKPFSTAIHAFMDEIFFVARSSITNVYTFVPYNFGSFDVAKEIEPGYTQVGHRGINYGDFFIIEPTSYEVTSPLATLHYVDMGAPDYGGGAYRVLRRDGTEFDLIRTAAKPIRIDISNNAPLLSVLDMENSFQSSFIFGDSLTQIIPVSGLINRRVDDYRYCYLEPSDGGLTISGMATVETGLFVTASGVFGGDIVSYSGGFQSLYDVPSGWGTRIETSNFGLGGQYIFITASGDTTLFYQKDPMGAGFVYYSGLPNSRATIVRLDDFI